MSEQQKRTMSEQQKQKGLRCIARLRQLHNLKPITPEQKRLRQIMRTNAAINRGLI
jgi:hypothetical protein